jgi:transposase
VAQRGDKGRRSPAAVRNLSFEPGTAERPSRQRRSYIQPERRIPATHPLRKVRELVREVLKDLSHTFGKLYSHEGRPSIPPEQLLSALLLQVFYSIRSERQLMEQLDYDLLFCWFVGLSSDDPIRDATVFTKKPGTSSTRRCIPEVHGQASRTRGVKPLLSDEHFSVDGTLIEALGLAQELQTGPCALWRTRNRITWHMPLCHAVPTASRRNARSVVGTLMRACLSCDEFGGY